MTMLGRPGFCVVTEISRAPAELVARIAQFPASILGDALAHRGNMDAGISPIRTGTRLCGTAVTVSTKPGDNLMAHVALKIAQPGDVIVIDAKGDQSCALWGDLMARAAKAKGVAGLIVDGPIRDLEELIEFGWPVYSRGANPRGPEKNGPGEVNQPISCGGVAVNPGDIILGDGDGVIVIPPDMAETALEGGAKRVDAEKDILDAIESVDRWPFDITTPLRANGVLGPDETI